MAGHLGDSAECLCRNFPIKLQVALESERGCLSAPRGTTRGTGATPLAYVWPLHIQHPVPSHDIPHSSDLAVLDHICLTMQRYRWTNVCGDGKDLVAGTIALGNG